MNVQNNTNNANAKDSRYPYTYACDYFRESMSRDSNGDVMSRSSASQAIRIMAEALGEEQVVVASKLADKYLERNLQAQA